MIAERCSRIMKSCTPFITIGIASYNYASYLQEAFEAIKRQTFKDFEILYADDGSTDNSVEIIESFIRENPDMNIRIITGQNAGVMANKQRLIDNAKGEYLMLCDADDWMDDDCLETLASVAKATHADRIVSEIRDIDGVTGKTMYVQAFPKKPSKWCEVLHHGALYKMNIIRENNIVMPDILPDDYIFITQFNLHAKSTEFIRKSVYNWRIHPKSLSYRYKHSNEYGGYILISNTLSFVNRLQKDTIDTLTEKDREDFKLFLVKNYFFYLIKDISLMRPLEKAKKEYHKLHSLMKKNIPQYQKLVFSRSFDDSPFRRILHIELTILCILENLHALFPVLIFYGAMFRFKNKDIMK